MAKYIKEKIKVLKHFKIKPTEEQIAYMNSLSSECAVDQYARTLILSSFE